MEAKQGRVIFRDVPSGAEIGRIPPQSEWLTAIPMFLSPDGRTLCCVVAYRWRLWDVPAGTVRFDGWWHPLAFHPSAQVYVAALSKGFALVSTQTGEVVREFDFDLGEARYACFAPDGLTCAVGGSNKRFAVFDVDV